MPKCNTANGWCGDTTRCGRCRLVAKDPAYRMGIDRSDEEQQVPRGVLRGPVVTSPDTGCPHLGDETGRTVGCRSCGGLRELPVYRCGLHGLTVLGDRAPASDTVRACRWCPDNPVSRPTRITIGEYTPRLGDPSVGVVVGSAWWAELAELQIRLVRRTCGDVPVLISADPHPDRPEYEPAVRGLADLPGVTVLCDERRGHTAGDAAAYWRGVEWGRDRGLGYVVKLSQRLLFTGDRWAQDAAAALRDSGLPLSTRKSTGKERYPLRTEFVVLDVAAWSRAGPLAGLKAIRHGGGPHGVPMEFAFAGLLAGLGWRYLPFDGLPADREAASPGVVWRMANRRVDYEAAAAAVGVTLPPDFTTGGWMSQHRSGRYDAG